MSFTDSQMYTPNPESDFGSFGMSEVDEVSNYMMHGCKINPRRQLQIIANCTRKVLIPGQVAIISFMPHAILWVTNNSQIEVGSSANDADEIADALETKMPRELSERVGLRIIRTAEQAVLGIQCRTTFEMSSPEQCISVGFDCYHDEPDFLTIVTLLTPIQPGSATLNYEQTQLSSLRYLVGVIMSGHDDMHILAATLESIEASRDFERYIRGLVTDGKNNYAASACSTDIVNPTDTFSNEESAPNPNMPHMYDFIPSMTFREIDYFYSMILGTAIGTYRRHENELQHSDSIDEQEKQSIDPDDMDPNERMRFMQLKAISPVIQRRPKDPTEIRAEIEAQRLRALSDSQNLANNNSSSRSNSSNLKNVGIKCLECGADSSPEWRKGPKGPKTLCNRCGLRFAKFLKAQK